MTESTGRVDRDSTLALLWRHTLGEPQGTRGPRQKVTVDQVVDVAIALADEDGLDALSMRAVAERLGIGAMSLYTYVESKSQLIELMVDQVTAELPTVVDPTVGWRERLERMARLSWEHYRRHPGCCSSTPPVPRSGRGSAAATSTSCSASRASASATSTWTR